MAEGPARLLKRVGYGLLSTALAGTLLYYSLRGVEWGRVWTTIAHARWEWLAASAGLTSCSFFCRSLRWRVLLNSEGRFDIPTVFGANMAGYLGNAFLPARAGEFLRTYLISSRSGLSAAFVFTTAVCERMMDAIVLVLASSVVLVSVHPKPAWLDDVSRTMAAMAGAGLVVIVMAPHTGNLCERILRWLPVPGGVRERLVGWSVQVLMGLRTLHSFRRLGGFLFWTVVIWTVDCASAVVCGRGLGVAMTMRTGLLLMAGLGLGSALPSAPGYVGIYQFVTVSVLGPFGVRRDAALAYALVNQALSYVVVTVFGLPGLWRAKRGGSGGIGERRG